MVDRRRILITGASGNIGAKIRRHLTAHGGFDLTLIDKDPKGDPAIIAADLSVYDQSWVRHFQGIDAVVHLAAEHRHLAPWAALEGPNVDAVINLYEASAAHAVRRVVFASSMHTVTGHPGSRVVSPEALACPGNLYGATKVVGERLGKSYAERHGVSVICLRIGCVQPGDNLPGPHMGDGWTQLLWLSDRDLCQGVERAILAGDVQFAVLNLTSDNLMTPWDLSQTTRILGYAPQDGHTPRPISLLLRLHRSIWRGKRRLRQLLRGHRAPS